LEKFTIVGICVHQISVLYLYMAWVELSVTCRWVSLYTHFGKG